MSRNNNNLNKLWLLCRWPTCITPVINEYCEKHQHLFAKKSIIAPGNNPNDVLAESCTCPCQYCNLFQHTKCHFECQYELWHKGEY